MSQQPTSQPRSTYVDAAAAPSGSPVAAGGPAAPSPRAGVKKALPWRMPSSVPPPLRQAVTAGTTADATCGTKAAATLSPPHSLYDELSAPPPPPRMPAISNDTADGAATAFGGEPPLPPASGDGVQVHHEVPAVVMSVPLAVTVAAVEAIPVSVAEAPIMQLTALPPPMQESTPPSSLAAAAAPSTDGRGLSADADGVAVVPPSPTTTLPPPQPPQGWADVSPMLPASSPTAAEMPPPLTPGKISALGDAYNAVQMQRGKIGGVAREPRTPSSNGSTRDATGSSGGRMWGNSPQAAPAAVRWGSHSLNATARIFQPSAASLAAAGQHHAAASSPTAGPTGRFSYSYAGSANHGRTASGGGGGGGGVRLSPHQQGMGLNPHLGGGAFSRSPPQSYPTTPPMSGNTFPKSGPFAAAAGGGGGGGGGTSTPPYGHSGFPPCFARPRPAGGGGHSPTLGPAVAIRNSAAPAHGGSFAAGSSMGDGDSIVQNVMVPVGLESEADVRDYVHFGDGYYYAADGTAFVRPHTMLDGGDDDAASMASSSDSSIQRFSRRRRAGGQHRQQHQRHCYGGGGPAGTGDSFASSACSAAGGSAMGQSLDEGERAWLEEQIRGTTAANNNNNSGSLF